MHWSFGDKLAIVIVGDEFTHGESAELNSPWIAKQLVNRGLRVELCVQLGDNIESISYWLTKIIKSPIDHVVVCGGIGGTHDDYTRQAVAKALNRSLVIHEACMSILESRYGDRLNDQRRRMAHLPEGSKLIENDQGAPGFQIENLTVLPGFPRMVQKMLLNLLDEMNFDDGSTILLEAYFDDCTEGDIALQVEAFNQQWLDRIISLGIYPDSRENVRIVRLKLRCVSTLLDQLLPQFKAFVKSLGGQLQ